MTGLLDRRPTFQPALGLIPSGSSRPQTQPGWSDVDPGHLESAFHIELHPPDPCGRPDRSSDVDPARLGGTFPSSAIGPGPVGLGFPAAAARFRLSSHRLSRSVDTNSRTNSTVRRTSRDPLQGDVSRTYENRPSATTVYARAASRCSSFLILPHVAARCRMSPHAPPPGGSAPRMTLPLLPPFSLNGAAHA